MEEVNFVRLPYLVNHTISAIKNDTVILLGRSSSKSILLYYIIRELHQINGKKCALLHNNEGNVIFAQNSPISFRKVVIHMYIIRYLLFKY